MRDKESVLHRTAELHDATHSRDRCDHALRSRIQMSSLAEGWECPCGQQAAAEGLDLIVIRLPAETKPMLQRQLSAVGISRKNLFPDLEGLSAFVNWGTRRTAHNKHRVKPDNEG